MKRLSGPPQNLYMVARIWEPNFTVGDTYGPYTRLVDAERCLARVGQNYTIIESSLRWTPLKETP